MRLNMYENIMPTTPANRLGLHRPPLGKRPWKKDWDQAMGILDAKIGTLIDQVATLQSGGAGDPTVTITGDLTGVTIATGTSEDIEVNHSDTKIFSFQLEPIFSL